MSGLMLKVSEPHIFPVLPKPQITSSATSKISYFSRTFWTFEKYDLGGIITPPAPITGSAKKAATVSGPSLRIKFSNSLASLSENCSSLSFLLASLK